MSAVLNLQADAEADAEADADASSVFRYGLDACRELCLLPLEMHGRTAG